MSGLFAVSSLSVCTAWFHNTVISPSSHYYYYYYYYYYCHVTWQYPTICDKHNCKTNHILECLPPTYWRHRKILILLENVSFCFIQQVVLAFHWVLSRFLREWLYLWRISGFKKLSCSFLVSKLVPLNNPDFLFNLLILHLSYILNYFFWNRRGTCNLAFFFPPLSISTFNCFFPFGYVHL